MKIKVPSNKTIILLTRRQMNEIFRALDNERMSAYDNHEFTREKVLNNAIRALSHAYCRKFRPKRKN